MKLSTFARRAGICYKTAWRWWKCGKIKGYQTETGTVIITEEISEQPGQERIVVEHKDRLTRFGFKYIETLLAMQGRSIEVVNVTENPIEDIIADFVSILYSFCTRLYGQRRARRKTEKIFQELQEEKEEKSA